MKEFITYKKFNDAELAKSYLSLLKEKNIDSIVSEDTNFFDPSFANNKFEFIALLKLKPEDFEKADQIIDDYFQPQLAEIDPGYYLYSFTDTELNEIVTKRDEWGHFDYLLAKKILKERGNEISQAEIESSKASRLKLLSIPEELSKYKIIIGYISAFILPFFIFYLGFTVIIIAWIAGYFKKTLPDGNRIYVYGNATRIHSKRILFITILTTFVAWILSLLGYFSLISGMAHLKC